MITKLKKRGLGQSSRQSYAASVGQGFAVLAVTLALSATANFARASNVIGDAADQELAAPKALFENGAGPADQLAVPVNAGESGMPKSAASQAKMGQNRIGAPTKNSPKRAGDWDEDEKAAAGFAIGATLGAILGALAGFIVPLVVWGVTVKGLILSIFVGPPVGALAGFLIGGLIGLAIGAAALQNNKKKTTLA